MNMVEKHERSLPQTSRTRHPASITQGDSSEDTDGFCISRVFVQEKLLLTLDHTEAGKRARENALILDQKEPHLFAPCVSASQRQCRQELMFLMHLALGGKVGPREAIGYSYASSWQRILATDVLP